ncbi:MAG: hypothetical protein N3D12_01130 [Candidatus Methanomethyliaceae archaeon]|nr:hypothetical protein [Candidatus Methanomethyliaceae archaeon]
MKRLRVLDSLIVISIVIFVVVLASVAYTIVKSVPTVNVGSPSQKITESLIEFTLPVFLKNSGLLPLSDIFVRATMESPEGNTIFELESNKLTLPPSTSGTLTVNMRMDISRITHDFLMSIMVEDYEFPVNATLRGSIQPFANLFISASGKLHWGAPYSNLRLLEPRFVIYNSTHLFLQVPISFINNSTMFKVSGMGYIRVMDEDGSQVGYGECYMDVKTGGQYNGSIDLYFQVPWVGRPDLITENVVKNYNVTMMLPAPLVGRIERTQITTMEWGVLIKDPQLGEFSVATHNSTHSRIYIPLRFEDASIFPFSGTLSGIIYDAAWNWVGQVEDLWLEVQPGQIYLGEISGYISNAVASQQKLYMLIILNMPYGTFERMVPINAKIV